jgi:hypothetical protein
MPPRGNFLPPRRVAQAWWFLRRFLRGRIAGSLWLVFAAWIFLLLWQALIGWPITKQYPVQFPASGAAENGLTRGKIPKKATIYRWNSPLARVSADGRELPLYATVELLREGTIEGCCTKGHSVYLKAPASDAARPIPKYTVRIPWTLPRAAFAGWSAAFLIVTALLWFAHAAMVRRAGALLSSRALFLVLLGALALGSLVLRFGCVSFPVWTPDTADYLRPAVQFLRGEPVQPSQRPFGYAIAAGVLLGLREDLQALVHVQFVGSILVALSLAGMLVLAGRRLFREAGWRSLAGLGALLAFALYALHENILRRDWDLLPEALASVLITAQLGLVGNLTARPAPRGAWLAKFALLCSLGWVTFFFRPNWGLALGFLPLPLLAAATYGRDRRELLRRLGAGFAIYVAICIVGLLIPGRLTPASSLIALEIRARVLVCWNLPLVRPEIERRLAADPIERERALLQELAKLLDHELVLVREKGPGAYPRLGYDGDRVFYDGFNRAWQYQKLSLQEKIDFCTGLFRAALRRDPAPYLCKVARQMGNLFENPYSFGYLHPPGIYASLALSQGSIDKQRYEFREPLVGRYRATLARAERELQGPAFSRARLALEARMVRLIGCTARGIGWWIGPPMALLAVAALLPAWRRAVSWQSFAPVLSTALWATGSALACALTSSLAQALEIVRYIDLFLPLTLYAQIVWPLIAVALLRSSFISRRRARDIQAGGDKTLPEHLGRRPSPS